MIRGDDVRDLVRDLDCELPELGTTVRALGDRIVSANAYIGAEPIVEALESGAQVVLGGRLADPSLFVGADLPRARLGARRLGPASATPRSSATCSSAACTDRRQLRGPALPRRPRPAPPRASRWPRCPTAPSVVTKLDGTGGAVDERTMKTQLYYEIHDPPPT